MKLWAMLIAAVALFVVVSITSKPLKPQGGREIVAVNGLSITAEEFLEELRQAHYGEYAVVDGREVLDNAIRRQLLIQEAEKFGFQKDPKFLRSIEQYWKQALIRAILDQKEAGWKGLSQEQRAEKLQAWMDEIRRRANIDIDEEAVRQVLKRAEEDAKTASGK